MGKLYNVIFSFLLLTLAVGTSAQNENLQGAQIQPGDLLYQQIKRQINYGQNSPTAINDAINIALSDTDTTLNATAKTILANDVILAKQFFATMIETKSLITVIKTLIELNMDKASPIIELGITLYPHLSNEVVDGAALSSNMSLEDIIIAAIQSGADLNHISSSAAHRTAAEPRPEAIPLGIGTGADGSNIDATKVPNN